VRVPSDDKPPLWAGDDAAMLRWLEGKLDELREKDGAKAYARRRTPRTKEEQQALFPEDSDEGAIAAAQRGDIEPVRRRHPRLAPFLHLPKRKRGQRYANPIPLSRHELRLALACKDVGRIRTLWQQHYGKQNRKAHDGETNAEWFAAKRWLVTVDKIMAAMKSKRLRLPG
jgi:hypothetical protein